MTDFEQTISKMQHSEKVIIFGFIGCVIGMVALSLAGFILNW